MDSLFGAEFPVAVKFFLAFVIVLGLIGGTFWVVRRFGATRLGTAATRGRQPRLAVIDAAAVDGRRRLVLIRRDNVEHLMMIGGPSDIVIEQNIVRAVPVAPPREMPGARAPEPQPRHMEPAPRPSHGEESSAVPPQLDLAPRPARAPVEERAPEYTPRAYPRHEPRPMRQQLPVEPLPRPTFGLEPRPLPPEISPPRAAPMAEPVRVPSPPPPPPPPAPAPAATLPTEAPPPEIGSAPPTADETLADMAQRLEAALRRPIAPDARPAEPRPAHSVEPAAPASEPGRPQSANEEPAPAASREAPKAPAPEAKPARSKTVLDNLEEEMASLLGRPDRKE